MKNFLTGFSVTFFVLLVIAAIIGFIAVPMWLAERLIGPDSALATIAVVAWAAISLSVGVGIGYALNDGEVE